MDSFESKETTKSVNRSKPKHCTSEIVAVSLSKAVIGSNTLLEVFESLTTDQVV
jgi:hypothetical protein